MPETTRFQFYHELRGRLNSNEYIGLGIISISPHCISKFEILRYKETETCWFSPFSEVKNLLDLSKQETFWHSI